VTREDAATKGHRLLVEGRLDIRRVDAEVILARVRSDSGRIYDVGWSPDASYCTCEARSRCSQFRAVQLVTVLEPVQRK
jgi:hypothetical protein